MKSLTINLYELPMIKLQFQLYTLW